MTILDGGQEDRGSLDNRFGYHKPSSDDIVDKHQLVRNQCQELAEMASNILPPSRELSLCLTKIEEAMFWANAGIARILNYTEG